ncbi:MAG TPA: carboxypeptidase-like regulatory domain-containing protein [Chitinophagaceae bacterium]|nr:carboxypeptidase-like regulatory domain-containing protein [Chitinophagaceae bacterium]
MNCIASITALSFYFLFFAFIFLSTFYCVDGQETNSHAFGRVLADNNELLAGTTVSVIHEPTQSKYVVTTRNDGHFHFFNLRPGGPYSIIISSIGYESIKKTNLYIHLSSKHFSLNNAE